MCGLAHVVGATFKLLRGWVGGVLVCLTAWCIGLLVASVVLLGFVGVVVCG